MPKWWSVLPPMWKLVFTINVVAAVIFLANCIRAAINGDVSLAIMMGVLVVMDAMIAFLIASYARRLAKLAR